MSEVDYKIWIVCPWSVEILLVSERTIQMGCEAHER